MALFAVSSGPWLRKAIWAACLALMPLTVAAQGAGSYGLKIYQVNSALYPFVQVYFRTFNERMQPLVNLNQINIGVMVKGRTYDPAKHQYAVQPIAQRPETIRTVLVLDASGSMAGSPFEAALRASARFVDGKRPQDEVAMLAIKDTKDGYEVVSPFERDPSAIARRMADVKADGKSSRIYDSIAAAIQMCALAGAGASDMSGQNFVASCAVVVFSDGRDDGSALSREELNARITQLHIPVPIYSVAYSRESREYFKNLEALSKNSFGIYFPVGDTVDRMQSIVEEISGIAQSDYVVTFRADVVVDGEMHAFKIGVEYPSGSGKINFDGSRFEAIEPPPVASVAERMKQLNATLPLLHPGASPYFDAVPPAASAQ